MLLTIFRTTAAPCMCRCFRGGQRHAHPTQCSRVLWCWWHQGWLPNLCRPASLFRAHSSLRSSTCCPLQLPIRLLIWHRLRGHLNVPSVVHVLRKFVPTNEVLRDVGRCCCGRQCSRPATCTAPSSLWEWSFSASMSTPGLMAPPLPASVTCTTTW